MGWDGIGCRWDGVGDRWTQQSCSMHPRRRKGLWRPWFVAANLPISPVHNPHARTCFCMMQYRLHCATSWLIRRRQNLHCTAEPCLCSFDLRHCSNRQRCMVGWYLYNQGMWRLLRMVYPNWRVCCKMNGKPRNIL